MTKQEFMNQIYMKEGDPPEKVTERLFCIAVINEGTEIAHRIFSRVLEYRSILKEAAHDS